MLNRLQRLLPEGLLADAAWLSRMGYSSALRARYLEGGWLERVARGVFRRPLYRPGLNSAEALAWQHLVVSLQTVMEHPVAVGGRTALELSGLAHYASRRGLREVHLYGDRPVPGWLGRLPIETDFVFHNARRLFSDEPIADALKALKEVLRKGDAATGPVHGSLDWHFLGDGGWPILLSTPERAVLELLDELPLRETFHQADVLMGSAASLSPERLSRLLRQCRSVKVKRLFLWFAERHGYAWFERLDLRGVDLGSGKRMLVRGGCLDAKYGITVPKDLDAGG